jgi:hypothetical protein
MELIRARWTGKGIRFIRGWGLKYRSAVPGRRTHPSTRVARIDDPYDAKGAGAQRILQIAHECRSKDCHILLISRDCPEMSAFAIIP